MGSDMVMWLCGYVGVAMWGNMGGRVGSGMVISFFIFFFYRYRQLLS